MDIFKEVFQRRKEVSTCWYNKASDLHASAGVLWKAIEAPADQQRGFSHAVACWSVYQMLCGMSLELILKAILVEKSQQPQATHKLDKLANEAGVAFEPKDAAILQILTEAIIWDGRYPVPLREEHHEKLNELHWDHLYDRVPNTSNLDIRRGNDNLDWDSFNRLWRVASDAYWDHC